MLEVLHCFHTLLHGILSFPVQYKQSNEGRGRTFSRLCAAVMMVMEWKLKKFKSSRAENYRAVRKDLENTRK